MYILEDKENKLDSGYLDLTDEQISEISNADTIEYKGDVYEKYAQFADATLYEHTIDCKHWEYLQVNVESKCVGRLTATCMDNDPDD